ncbi:MAG: TonB-dependent receptor, partial [Janthinobacterium sp.]
MTFAAPVRRAPLVVACAFAVSTFATLATAQETLAPVVVTAARFPTTATPIGATVITADQIRSAGVADVNAAIRKIGGVFGR